MLLSSRYSFRLVSKKQIRAQQVRRIPTRLPPLESSLVTQGVDKSASVVPPPAVESEPEYVDSRKRSFLKLASMAGLGAVAVSMIPKKAEAYVMGASPTSGVVGVKNASNTRVNPATEETLLQLMEGQGVTKITTTLTASGDIHVPASGKKIRVYSTRFSLTADMANVSFRFTAGGSDYEKYLSPKTGGLYGANNHPNYVEGGIDQALYCVISGTGSVQINLDYMEV